MIMDFNWINRKGITIILLFLPIFNALARSPAVLPVKGISIEQYKEVKNPKQVPGFDFSTKTANPTIHNQMVYIFSILIISALLSMICGLILIKQQSHQGPQKWNNVLKFVRSKKHKKTAASTDEDDDDQDYKKAS